MTSYYVTTSIPYVNARPHLGHALELVQADVLARHRRARGDDVRLQSGTDDNSLKNVQAAERAGIPVQELVDRNADQFEALEHSLDLAYDDFIRTSRDPRHLPGVQRLWQQVEQSGDLYRKHYEGRYCVGCEDFVTAPDLIDGRCPEHETEPVPVSEENWFFRLSRYQDALLELYDSGAIRIQPPQRANEVRAFVASGLRDFSISRSVERAHGWGVPVPGDPTQVMYVWWDALGNYVTSLEYGDPGSPAYEDWWAGDEARQVHVIGKGILRFHAVYWPAMLLSAGQPVPTDIFVHDYLTANGRRLSKSLGNVVDPAELAAAYGSDALRWWLISQVPKVGDTDFTVERLVETANRDLAGGIGNLVQRVTRMIERYRSGVVPGATGLRQSGRSLVPDLRERIDAALADFDLRAAAAALMDAVGEANRYVEEAAPWSLAQAERTGADDARHDLDIALRALFDTSREIVGELRPFLPVLAERVTAQLTESPVWAGDPPFPRLEAASNVR